MTALQYFCVVAVILGVMIVVAWYFMHDIRTNAGTWRPGQPMPQPDMRFAGNDEDPDGSDGDAADDDGGL
jgi:hypothetical protein